MPYVLGIDIGSSNTAAAVARRRGATWTRPEAVPLSAGSPLMPSVLCLAEDGSLRVGEPVTDDGSRTTRDFVHRIGDDVPVLLGGEPCAPQTLTAELAAWVVERVHALEGGAAEAIVLSHPAGWRPYRREVLHRALSDLGLRHVTLLPRTVTVAESHAARGFAGSTAVVYALGGNSFEAALVRRTPRGTYETFGTPQVSTRSVAADFDEALAEHARTVLAREFVRDRASRGPGRAARAARGVRPGQAGADRRPHCRRGADPAERPGAGAGDPGTVRGHDPPDGAGHRRPPAPGRAQCRPDSGAARRRTAVRRLHPGPARDRADRRGPPGARRGGAGRAVDRCHRCGDGRLSGGVTTPSPAAGGRVPAPVSGAGRATPPAPRRPITPFRAIRHRGPRSGSSHWNCRSRPAWRSPAAADAKVNAPTDKSGGFPAQTASDPPSRKGGDHMSDVVGTGTVALGRGEDRPRGVEVAAGGVAAGRALEGP